MEWSREAGREDKKNILFSASSAVVLPARAGSSHQATLPPGYKK